MGFAELLKIKKIRVFLGICPIKQYDVELTEVWDLGRLAALYVRLYDSTIRSSIAKRIPSLAQEEWTWLQSEDTFHMIQSYRSQISKLQNRL